METIIKETDPRIILQVNPQAAIDEGFSALEQRVRKLAELWGYNTNNPQTQGISMAQFLRNVDAIPSGTLKIWEILKNVRDQAMYARVDPGSARKFLDLLDPELKKLDPLIASQSGKQNGIANA